MPGPYDSSNILRIIPFGHQFPFLFFFFYPPSKEAVDAAVINNRHFFVVVSPKRVDKVTVGSMKRTQSDTYTTDNMDGIHGIQHRTLTYASTQDSTCEERFSVKNSTRQRMPQTSSRFTKLPVRTGFVNFPD